MAQVRIATDPQWFWYCLESLSQFCLDFASDQTFMWQLTRQQDQLCLELACETIIFEPSQQLQMFEPFYSSRQLLGKKDVGLAFVKGFILQMKGEIQCDSGKGFCLLLPIAD